MRERIDKSKASIQNVIEIAWKISFLGTASYCVIVYLLPMSGIIPAVVLNFKVFVEVAECTTLLTLSGLRVFYEMGNSIIEIEYGGHYISIKSGNKVVVLRCLEISTFRGHSFLDELNPQYDTGLLMAIRAGLTQGINLAYEVGVNQGRPFIRFTISGVGFNVETVDKDLHRVAARIEAILVSAMKMVEIKQLQSHEIIDTIFGVFTSKYIEQIKKQLITLMQSGSADDRVRVRNRVKYWREIRYKNTQWLVKGFPRILPTIDTTQIGRFLSALLQQDMSVSMVCIFSPATPKREKRKLEGQWQKIRSREKQKEDTLADYSRKEKLIERFREIQDSNGWFNVTTNIILHTEKSTDKILAEECLKGLLYSIWGGTENFEVETIKRNLSNVLRTLSRRHTKSQKMHVSNLSAFIHTPVQEIPELSAPDYPEFRPPSKSIIADELFIGWSIYKGRKLNQVGLKAEWIREHIAILGATGTGKTTLVRQIISEISIKTDVPWWIFDVKGSEYADLAKRFNDVVLLQPGKDPNFVIKLLNTQTENQLSIDSTFTLLNELLHERSTSSDLTPAMEKLLRDALQKMLKTPEDGSIFRLREIIEKTPNNVAMQITKDALLNRLEILTRPPLGNILKGGDKSIDIGQFLNKRVIFDLRHVARMGGMDAARILYNLIAKRIFESAMRRGIISGLKHVVVLEEASNLVPESYTRQTAADITTGESMVMLQRATGQGVIVVSTRPNISSNILANTATKIVFRLPYDSVVGARFLSLDEKQERYLRSLKTGRAIIVTPVSEAFEIETIDNTDYKKSEKRQLADSKTSMDNEVDDKIISVVSHPAKRDEVDPEISTSKILLDKTANIISSVVSLLSSKGYLLEGQIYDVLRVLDPDVTDNEIKEIIRELTALGTIKRESIGIVPGGFVYTLPNKSQMMVKQLVIDHIRKELIKNGFNPDEIRVTKSEIYVRETVILVSPENIRASTIEEKVKMFKKYVQNIGSEFRQVIIIVRGSVAAAKIREHIADNPQLRAVSVIPAFPNSILKMITDNIKTDFTKPKYNITKKEYKIEPASTSAKISQSANKIWAELIEGYVGINSGRVRWEELMDFIETASIQSRRKHSAPIFEEDGQRALSELLIDQRLYAFRATEEMEFELVEQGLWIVNKETLQKLKHIAVEALETELKGKHIEVEMGHAMIDICADGVSYLIFPNRQTLTKFTHKKSNIVCDICGTRKLVCIFPAIEYADEVEQIPRYIKVASLDHGITGIIK